MACKLDLALQLRSRGFWTTPTSLMRKTKKIIVSSKPNHSELITVKTLDLLTSSLMLSNSSCYVCIIHINMVNAYQYFTLKLHGLKLTFSCLLPVVCSRLTNIEAGSCVYSAGGFKSSCLNNFFFLICL